MGAATASGPVQDNLRQDDQGAGHGRALVDQACARRQWACQSVRPSGLRKELRRDQPWATPGCWHPLARLQGEAGGRLLLLHGGGQPRRKSRPRRLKHHKMAWPELFRISPVLFSLQTREQAELFVETARAHGWEIKLIIVDTLARSLAGGNENS